ncbi:class I SAM-dependent methyltransferase [Methylovirgula sp. 4M-Z18]|uniref:class I SAM-dependent methyltransferase n=1 Tax=Methylovirgula sp. 4M-Z18 TaxID=2293567 RepID=UPI000E2E5803|nr:class I SAM-dependent methyltransferase [Methylovirgula sp. 4M-Z18]RFB75511.1 class I SAM-dependent methyltransferase [Methylovirgula sp. 4M-Z18]
MIDQGKIERERQFHNERFIHEADPRQHLDKWYASIRHGAEWQNELVRRYANNADVLEYGCSTGGLSIDELRLPEICRSFTGIDISDVAIAKANRHADAAGFTNARFLAMDAEAMSFADGSFDLVFGRGIIHHLDIDKSFGGIARVLRKDGVAIFCEPMGHNPILNLYRKTTPDIRTIDEHPLKMADFVVARRHFARVETKFYGLFSAASRFLDPASNRLPYRASKAFDNWILRAPAIGRYAWYCLIVCHKG